jgi:integrase
MHFLPPADLVKVFRAAYASKKPTARRNHLAMLTAFYTGSRISQWLAIRGEDIIQRDGKWVILIQPAKGGKSAIRSLHIDADPALDMSPLIELAQVRKRALLFDSLRRQSFNDALDEYCEAAGVHSSFAHSHMFRHSATPLNASEP